MPQLIPSLGREAKPVARRLPTTKACSPAAGSTAREIGKQRLGGGPPALAALLRPARPTAGRVRQRPECQRSVPPTRNWPVVLGVGEALK